MHKNTETQHTQIKTSGKHTDEHINAKDGNATQTNTTKHIHVERQRDIY